MANCPLLSNGFNMASTDGAPKPLGILCSCSFKHFLFILLQITLLTFVTSGFLAFANQLSYAQLPQQSFLQIVPSILLGGAFNLFPFDAVMFVQLICNFSQAPKVNEVFSFCSQQAFDSHVYHILVKNSLFDYGNFTSKMKQLTVN